MAIYSTKLQRTSLPAALLLSSILYFYLIQRAYSKKDSNSLTPSNYPHEEAIESQGIQPRQYLRECSSSTVLHIYLKNSRDSKNTVTLSTYSCEEHKMEENLNLPSVILLNFGCILTPKYLLYDSIITLKKVNIETISRTFSEQQAQMIHSLCQSFENSLIIGEIAYKTTEDQTQRPSLFFLKLNKRLLKEKDKSSQVLIIILVGLITLGVLLLAGWICLKHLQKRQRDRKAQLQRTRTKETERLKKMSNKMTVMRIKNEDDSKFKKCKGKPEKLGNVTLAKKKYDNGSEDYQPDIIQLECVRKNKHQKRSRIIIQIMSQNESN